MSRNGRSGVNVDASTAIITNNFIVKNGAAAAISALRLGSLTDFANSRFEFNTITGNVADQSAAGGGVSCASSAHLVRNSIIYANSGTGQVFGCATRFSTIEGATPDAVNGIINDAPAFISTAGDNYHLMPGSLLAGKADPTTLLMGPTAVDIDGEPRPQTGTAADLGADEIP